MKDAQRTNTDHLPAGQRVLITVADIICEGEENVVLAARRLKAENERLRLALIQAEPIVEYVSMGRGWVGTQRYPDATARRVNAQIKEALGGR